MGRRQIRQIGDTRTAIAAKLYRPDKTIEDLTGLTVNFAMYDTEGTAKVEETSEHVTVTDAEAGEVQYDPQAADVDTVGTFYAYFIIEENDAKDTFPAVKGDLIIDIQDVA